MQVAENSGIRSHLHEIFGKELGEDLLYLSIYKLTVAEQ